MKYLKTFEGLSNDILDKIKLLNNPGYYLNSSNADPVKIKNVKNLDLLFKLEDKIKEIFKGYNFDIVMNSLGKNLFEIGNDDGEIKISIVEMEDEYFYVVLKKIKRLSAHSIVSDSSTFFVADQTDGLIYLLTDIHKIINEK
jgi:hypothetical protein